jgi:hypothetical protein
MDNQILSRIIDYLNNVSKYKWSTSKKLIDELNIGSRYAPSELDEALLSYYEESADPEIRFSTLPSLVNLNVLWGSIHRVGIRNVTSIYKKDTPLEIKDFNNSADKNMFISYSFKDSELVLELSKKLVEYGINPWIAEIEILEHGHINQSVIEAIKNLPYFGTFISNNILQSTWSAKEIGFALHQKKDIFGFIHTNDQGVVESLNELQTESKPGIRDEIFRRLFDNKQDIKFLLYPHEGKVMNFQAVRNGTILNWEELNSNL